MGLLPPPMIRTNQNQHEIVNQLCKMFSLPSNARKLEIKWEVGSLLLLSAEFAPQTISTDKTDTSD